MPHMCSLKREREQYGSYVDICVVITVRPRVSIRLGNSNENKYYFHLKNNAIILMEGG